MGNEVHVMFDKFSKYWSLKMDFGLVLKLFLLSFKQKVIVVIAQQEKIHQNASFLDAV